jgi:hypothetical protein
MLRAADAMKPTPTRRRTWSATAPTPAARAPTAVPPPSADPLELEARRSKLRERFRRAAAKTKD